MKARLEKLRAWLTAQKLDAVIVNNFENRHYFSGFTGTSGLLVVTEREAKLITDFRYVEQAGKQALWFSVVEHGQSDLLVKAADLLKDFKAAKIGFEGEYSTYHEFTVLQQQLASVQLEAIKLDQLRMDKDAGELALMRKAVAISDQAFRQVLNILRPGVSELTIAVELEYVMRKLGSQRPAFATIVASGQRGSLPHGLATDKIIEVGDLVTMDFGAVYEGYHSDITRTVCVGKASEKQRHIYNIVLEAQLLGIKSIQVGKPGKMIDEIVRRYIADAGYGKFFGHGLGHGVGLAIHEQPRLSPWSTCEALGENMLVTVEPGIYLPGWGGVRIEDTVLITAQGTEILTQSSKQLIEIE